MIRYTSNVSLTIDSISLIMKNIGRIAHDEMKQFLEPYIVSEIKQFIQDGGSDDPKYSWGYWRKIGSQWSYNRGKMTSFSSGWKSATILPIHPMSFLARSIRKVPQSTQFALLDTRELIDSFQSVSSFYDSTTSEMQIGSHSPKLDYHEFQFKYKRPIIEPYSHIFAQDIKVHEKYMNKVIDKLERFIR